MNIPLPILQVIQQLPVQKLVPAYALWGRIADKTANQLQMADIREVLDLFGYDVTDGRLAELDELARSAPADKPAAEWAQELTVNGVLERLLAPPQQTALVRCGFCNQPNDVSTAFELHRCRFCEQPISLPETLTH